ncbi:GntR family transcriptional regulator [Alcaligenaceae bacterium]|nr:GntR family transcriptional regulator [Alcaligenaceae bacterium]
MNQSLSPIAGQLSLSELAYQQIRNAIVQGRLESGRRLVYRTLAEELGISPTPVRDAIQRLVSDGALQLDDRGVAIVPVITADTYIEIINLRLNLESVAAQAVALMPEGRDDVADQLEAIHQGVADSQRQGRVNDALHGNEQFHFHYLHAAHMPVLEELVRSLWLRCGPSLRLAYSNGFQPLPVHPHLRLIQAIRRADPIEARLAVEEDLKYAGKHILSQLDADAVHRVDWD